MAALVGIALAVAALIAYIVVPSAVTYVRGDDVVAHVGECRSYHGGFRGGSSTECDAWWLVDGMRKQGILDDADRDHEGKQVRADGSKAVPASAPRELVWVLIIGAVVIVGGWLGGRYAFGEGRRRRG